MPTSIWTLPATSDDAVHSDAAHDSPPVALDPGDDHANVLAAIASGAVPTFEHNPATDPDKVADPIDKKAEAEAYRELVEAIRQSAEPGTTITLMDPDAFAKGIA